MKKRKGNPVSPVFRFDVHILHVQRSALPRAICEIICGVSDDLVDLVRYGNESFVKLTISKSVLF